MTHPLLSLTPEELGDGTSRYEVKINHQTITPSNSKESASPHPLMIAIINITPEGLGDGTSRYEVRVNHQTIAQFIHCPSDGLYRCLMRAAYAVLKK